MERLFDSTSFWSYLQESLVFPVLFDSWTCSHSSDCSFTLSLSDGGSSSSLSHSESVTRRNRDLRLIAHKAHGGIVYVQLGKICGNEANDIILGSMDNDKDGHW